MLRRLLLTAIVAGSVGGLAITLLQLQTVVPMILAAEAFEDGAPPAPAIETAAHDHQAHQHAAAPWQPADGAERTVVTAAANILVGIGFSMLLVACFTLRGRPVGFAQGLLWGLAGYAAFAVAPALGLPPELPGTFAAPLVDRQAWWLGTVAATAAGLALIVFVRAPWAKALGGALLLVPHLVGAPHPDAEGTLAPPELADAFILASLASAAVLWLGLGGLNGWLFGRWGAQAQQT